MVGLPPIIRIDDYAVSNKPSDSRPPRAALDGPISRDIGSQAQRNALRRSWLRPVGTIALIEMGGVERAERQPGAPVDTGALGIVAHFQQILRASIPASPGRPAAAL